MKEETSIKSNCFALASNDLLGIMSKAKPRFDNRYGDKHKEEWLTPPEIIRALGEFDLDPCAPVNRVWEMAKFHYTELENGLMQKWFGRVWLNPPYGNQTGKWLEILAAHGNGVALTFARTETRMFFDSIWNKASALLFIKGRLTFYHADGTRGAKNSGAPSVLIAYGDENALALQNSNIKGALVRL